jgi:hypothetical protein
MKKFLPLAAIIIIRANTALGGSFPAVSEYSLSSFSFVIQANQPEREIEIFPNPVTEGRLTISSNDEIFSIKIMNITGKTVFSEEYESGMKSMVVELDKLEKGIYLVRLGFSDETTYTGKIMVK